MTGRRRIWVAIAGILAVAIVGSGVAWLARPARRDGLAQPTTKAPTLSERLGRGDTTALNSLCQEILSKANKAPVAIGEAEGPETVEVLHGLRAGFMKFPAIGRASAISASGHLFDRFGVEPAPNAWIDALQPIHDILIAGLADASSAVRTAALTEIGRRWSWLPGRTMTPFEEHTLADWKWAVYRPAVRCLSDLNPQSRAAAVVCIGSVTIESLALPAVANVEYPDDAGVRYKALMTFANRPSLLSVDAVLKRLHDPATGVKELAELILKGRGLTREQIALGRQMFDSRPEVRASVIPMLKQRTDIDTDVWMLQLSHDADDTVRAKAVEALVDRDTPEVDSRLKEMASSDTSASVRAAAGKHVARSKPDETAALPPLPGSTSLNPKAN